MLYGFAMSKITDQLSTLEKSPITGHSFIEAKVRIQDELWKLMNANPDDTEAHRLLSRMHRTWRLLGGPEGTLLGYTSAICDLNSTLHELAELGIDA
jgi:hypothetical protein